MDNEFDNPFELEIDAAILKEPLTEIEEQYRAMIAEGVAKNIAWEWRVDALAKPLTDYNENSGEGEL